MSRGVYMDVHVPSAITDGLVRRGVDVLTAQADDAGELDDESLLQRATDLGRILFTRDEDLLAIGAAWQQQSRELPASSTRINWARASARSSSSWSCWRSAPPMKRSSISSFICR